MKISANHQRWRMAKKPLQLASEWFVDQFSWRRIRTFFCHLTNKHKSRQIGGWKTSFHCTWTIFRVYDRSMFIYWKVICHFLLRDWPQRGGGWADISEMSDPHKNTTWQVAPTIHFCGYHQRPKNWFKRTSARLLFFWSRKQWHL